MTATDAGALMRILRRLARPREPDALRMVPLAGNAWIGVFGSGAPAIFFELAPRQPGTARSVARGLELIVSSRFEMVGPASRRARTRSGYAVALRDSALIDIFAAVAAHLAARLRVLPAAFETQTDVDRYLAEWIDFFSGRSLSHERAIGLWGELYVLSVLPSVDRGVACWVGPYGQMFDFMGNGVSLEVKTSLRTAVASFSLGQTKDRDDGHAVFLRVLKDDKNGKSLDMLVAEIRRELQDPVEFDATLVRAGYTGGINAEMKLTGEDLRAVPNAKIPRPLVTDDRIRSVRYEVDVDALSHDFVPVSPLLRRLTARSSAALV